MAQDYCCDSVIGGTYFVKINGKTYEGLGELTINPSAVERTATATENGRLVVTEKAKLVTAKLAFANKCDANPRDIWTERCPIDVVFVESSRGKRHMLNKAVAVGSPEINVSTGNVSGIDIACDHRQYKVVDAA